MPLDEITDNSTTIDHSPQATQVLEEDKGEEEIQLTQLIKEQFNTTIPSLLLDDKEHSPAERKRKGLPSPTKNPEEKKEPPTEKKTNKLKKKRSESPENLSQLISALEPIRKTVELSPNKYILNFEEIIKFLEESHNSGEYLKTANNYIKMKKEMPSFILALHEIRKQVSGAVKNRITRVVNRLSDEFNAELETEWLQSSQSNAE